MYQSCALTADICSKTLTRSGWAATSQHCQINICPLDGAFLFLVFEIAYTYRRQCPAYTGNSRYYDHKVTPGMPI